jgi:ribosome-associated protein
MEEKRLTQIEKAKKITKIAVAALEDKKGEEIRVIDISKISIMADYFIIANGTNEPQIRALVEHVEEALEREGYQKKQREGTHKAGWILLDFTDVIIHIFDKENRLFYDLERIWRDGKIIDINSL